MRFALSALRALCASVVGWDQRFIVGREVGDVLRVEERLLLDEAESRQAGARAQRLVAAQVGVEVGQDDLVSADRREGVVVRWLRHRIEAALPRDEIEPRQPCLGREVLIGLVVRLGGGEEQGVVRRGLRVVRLGRFVGGGAAAEGGEDEEGECGPCEHEREAAGVLGDAAQ